MNIRKINIDIIVEISYYRNYIIGCIELVLSFSVSNGIFLWHQIVGQNITIVLSLIVGQNDTQFVGQNDVIEDNIEWYY